ncbi:MAG: hypothetical protein GX162_07175 [Firmicutes bacterium]|jgi:hypothetical protein|nr:hypothetical protein [Bacillota bacterium]
MSKQIIENPYQDVDWKNCSYLHSMSHQHSGSWTPFTDYQSLVEFFRMGFRHMAVSNYYPSKPVYPLPKEFAESYPEAIGCPNAEHHSFTDAGMHICAIGSYYTSGYGQPVESSKLVDSPIQASFDGLHRFDPEKPWLGVYRLDIDLRPKDGADTDQVSALLTIEGGSECDRRSFDVIGAGRIHGRRITSSGSLYIRTESDSIAVGLEFDENTTEVTRIRLMQGTNRPYAQVFAEALDGTGTDAEGNRIEGLVFPDGGGITINHPEGSAEHYFPILDQDERVLGIEVWNYRRRFGYSRSNLHAYRLWDEILSSGRRCFGFFVKDHRRYGNGRNVLLIPNDDTANKEHEALKAYRKGRFFGLLGSIAVDGEGNIVQPYDYSQFRFTNISVREDDEGCPLGVDVSVAGDENSKNKNTQIRFVTNEGIAQITDADQAFFPFPKDQDGNIVCKFVRIEAIAYPDRLDDGRQLTPDSVARMNPDEIMLLHNHRTFVTEALCDKRFGLDEGTPVPALDMILSQPIMIRQI